MNFEIDTVLWSHVGVIIYIFNLWRFFLLHVMQCLPYRFVTVRSIGKKTGEIVELRAEDERKKNDLFMAGLHPYKIAIK